MQNNDLNLDPTFVKQVRKNLHNNAEANSEARILRDMLTNGLTDEVSHDIDNGHDIKAVDDLPPLEDDLDDLPDLEPESDNSIISANEQAIINKDVNDNGLGSAIRYLNDDSAESDMVCDESASNTEAVSDNDINIDFDEPVELKAAAPELNFWLRSVDNSLDRILNGLVSHCDSVATNLTNAKAGAWNRDNVDVLRRSIYKTGNYLAKKLDEVHEVKNDLNHFDASAASVYNKAADAVLKRIIYGLEEYLTKELDDLNTLKNYDEGDFNQTWNRLADVTFENVLWKLNDCLDDDLASVKGLINISKFLLADDDSGDLCNMLTDGYNTLDKLNNRLIEIALDYGKDNDVLKDESASSINPDNIIATQSGLYYKLLIDGKTVYVPFVDENEGF